MDTISLLLWAAFFGGGFLLLVGVGLALSYAMNGQPMKKNSYAHDVMKEESDTFWNEFDTRTGRFAPSQDEF